MKVKSEVAQSCLTMDCSPPGSSIHGIFQARVLEWGAIAFSEMNLEPIIHPLFSQEKEFTALYFPVGRRKKIEAQEEGYDGQGKA